MRRSEFDDPARAAPRQTRLGMLLGDEVAAPANPLVSQGPSGIQPYPPMPQYSAAYGYPGAPGPTPGLLYVNFWRRFGAYLIDSLIVAAVSLPLVIPLVYGPLFDAYRNAVTVDPSGVTHVRSISVTDIVPSGTLLIVSLVTALLGAAYFGVLVSLWGHTIGQALIGARVVRQEDPSARLPLERGLLRAIPWWGGGLAGFVPILGTVVQLLILLALLWVAWDPFKQGLHDKLAHAIVVRPDPNPMLIPYGYGYAPTGYGNPPPGTPPPGYGPYPHDVPPPGYGAVPGVEYTPPAP